MRTTININNKLLKRLMNTSEILKISTNDLIAILINTLISKNNLEVSIFKSVKYQNKDSKKNWKKFHVNFEPQMYEKNLDLKKVYKVSVSFFISFAIIHHLDKVVEKLTQEKEKGQIVANYPLNYIIITKKYDDIQGFTILWGMPEEKTLEKLLP